MRWGGELGRVSRRARFVKGGVYGGRCLIGEAGVRLQNRIGRKLRGLRMSWSRCGGCRENHVYSVGGAGASTFSGAWIGGAHGVRSTVGPGPGGGVELEEAQLGPLSKASSSAILVAIWLTVPSRAAIRAWSLVAMDVGEAGGRGAPEGAGGGRCVGRALEYAGSTPAGVRGGKACVCGG
ncbi:hypothetical protein CRG98_047210 [Punica granatum]|uniref:Uncharacterized protein n=1 Tax=Punica granatum TaxID=22663 RepID=A0A2I0HL07_PUNGR|nr:hypothetical protein CRG98_047210 [Punica granatum]